MKYTHIFWDWNGTLLDDAGCAVECVNQTLRDNGLPESSLAEYHEIIEFPLERYYAKLFDMNRFSYRYLLTRFQQEYAKRAGQLKLNDGAAVLLERLRAQGRRQYIVSAFEHHALCEHTKRLGVSEYFEAISGADDIDCGGKAERVAALLHGLDTRQAVYIGDTTADFEVASSLGLDCILAAVGHQPRRTLERVQPMAVVDSLNEIEQLI